MPQKYVIDVPEDTLEDVRRRIADCRFPVEPKSADWELGTPVHFMRKVQQYFLDEYDWRATERELNLLPNFRTEIDGLSIHFIHRRCERPDAIPLLVLHGWPGSIIEFVDLIEPLAQGNGTADSVAFHVIVPSLPGFGFSDVPDAPMTPRQIARIFHRLMTEELGYDRYAVQGGDWGSMVAGWLGFDVPEACKAVHWTMMGLSPGGDSPGFTAARIAAPETVEELEWAARCSTVTGDFGYASIQSTRPQSLGFAMTDSPMGVMAWILEKFHAWTDRRDMAVDDLIPLARLIDNLMLYILPDRFVSASWMYRSLITEGNALPVGQRIEAALGMAAVAHDVIPPPPRSYVEKCGRLVHWSNLPRGGHFLSLEQPDLWLDDVRKFAFGQTDAFTHVESATA